MFLYDETESEIVATFTEKHMVTELEILGLVWTIPSRESASYGVQAEENHGTEMTDQSMEESVSAGTRNPRVRQG